MKFLTDENTSKHLIRGLRQAGFGVKDIREENLESRPDQTVVDFAHQEDLIIVTLDTDFPKLFSEGKIKAGVIFIHHKRQKSKQITERLLKFIASKTEEEIIEKLSIVE